MTGGHAVARMMALHGVDHTFGMGGFQLLPYYNGARELGLQHHLTDDERSAGFVVDAMSRVTGKPGVVDATQGPGATNLVTSLTESFNAGIPIVALVGDTHRDHSWKNMTQEARQIEVLRPVVKEVIRIESGTRIPELVRRAFAVATCGRPGPVVLDLPEDISHEEFDFCEAEFWVDPSNISAPSLRSRPESNAVTIAANVLRVSKRPIILVGGGVHLSGASDVLQGFAEAQGIPVAHTLSGKGAIACTHSLSVGLFGRYSRYANELIEQADCLLVIGCKLGEIATKRYKIPGPEARVIHLDVLPEELGRWARTEVALCGDAKSGLQDLSTELKNVSVDRKEYLDEVREREAVWQNETSSKYEAGTIPIHMARLIGELNSLLPEDSIVVADGGFASHWAGLFYDTKRSGRGFIADRGFASIGYGLPGALGAALAAPERAVVGLTGDGGLNMTIGGLETARRIGAKFILIVVNNAASGYVKALQHAVYGVDSYQSSDLMELNYADLAQRFDCVGIRVERPEELHEAIQAGLNEPSRPTVIDVVVTRDPGQMLPGVDNRTATVEKGDRIA